MSATLAAEHVTPHIRGRFGKPYRYEPECESTRSCSSAPAAEGAVAAMDHQTEGRAARSPLARAALLRPRWSCSIPQLNATPTRSSPRSRPRRRSRRRRASPQIKWPNDVMLNRGRCGISPSFRRRRRRRHRHQRPPTREELSGHDDTRGRPHADRPDARLRRLLGSLLFDSSDLRRVEARRPRRPLRRGRRPRLPPRTPDHDRRPASDRAADPPRWTPRGRWRQRPRREARDRVGRGALRALASVRGSRAR